MTFKTRIGIGVLASALFFGCNGYESPRPQATPSPQPTPGIWALGELIPNSAETAFALQPAPHRRTIAPGTPIAGYEHVITDGWDDYLGQVMYRGALGQGSSARALFSFACTKQVAADRPYSFSEEYVVPVGEEARIGLRCPFVPDGKFGEQRLEFRVESIDEHGYATIVALVGSDSEKR